MTPQDAVTYLMDTYGMTEVEAQAAVDELNGDLNDLSNIRRAELDDIGRQRESDERNDINEDGEVAEEEDQRAQVEGQIAQITEDGVTEEEVGPLGELQAVLAGFSGSEPPELTRYLGGRPLATDEVEDAIELYNSFSPNPIENAQELYDRWSSNDAMAWEAISSIRAGEGSEWMRIGIGSQPGTGRQRTFEIQANRYAALTSNFNGFATGQGAVFTAVDRNKGQGGAASAYAGALAVVGGFAPAGSLQSGKKSTQIEAEVNRQIREGALAHLNEQADGEFHRWTEDEIQGAIDELWSDSEIAGLRRRLTAGLEVEAGTNGPANQRVRNEQTTRRYDEAYRRFHNHGLALLYLRSPKDAEAIFQSGRITDVDQAQRVRQVFLDAGYNEQQWANQGDAFDGAMWDALLAQVDPSAAGAGGGAPVIDVTLPDPAALNESMRNLYRAWFRRDPTQAELDGFTSDINGAITANTQTRAGAAQAQMAQGFDFATGRFRGQGDPTAPIISTVTDVNAEARMLAKLRSTDEYSRLFGSKPQGLSEEQYVGLFERAANSFAPGSVVGDEAIRSGMQTGTQQTTVGRIFGDAQVWKDDSTFLERMTNAARSIARMT